MNDLLEDIVDQRTQHGSIFISSYSSSLFGFIFKFKFNLFFCQFFCRKISKMNIERGAVLEMGLFFANQDLQDNIIMDRAKQQYQSSLFFSITRKCLKLQLFCCCCFVEGHTSCCCCCFQRDDFQYERIVFFKCTAIKFISYISGKQYNIFYQRM